MRLLLGVLLASAALAAPYAGTETCRKCHPAQFASQSTTGHAHALARSRPDQPGEWAFGAGVQATTFVSRFDSANYLEHGETWYRASNGFAITPGHANSTGLKYRTLDPSAQILRCFACHTTGPLKLAPDESIAPSESGVRCEVCHGPAADHAASPATVHPRNPGKMTAAQLNTLCGSCHRMMSTAEETTDLRDPWNSRHQPLLLSASQCFLKSAGRLSCITCHSPHQPLNQNVASYNNVCSGCHAAVKHMQPVADRACAECHMPKVRPNENLAFSNHRIGVYAASDPLSPVLSPSSPAKP